MSYVRTEEHRRLMSLAVKATHPALPHSLEARAKMRQGWTAERRQAASDRMKRRQQDPAFKAIFRAAMVEFNQRDSTRAIRREAFRRMWEDPAFRDRMLAGQPARTAAMRAWATTPTGREKMSLALRQSWESDPGRRLTASAAQSQRILRRGKSGLERRAEDLLGPLGFMYHGRKRERHHFDFALGALVIEVNGCFFHDHHAVGRCTRPTRAPDEIRIFDDRIRAIALRHNLALLELWECEEARWAEQIAAFVGD